MEIEIPVERERRLLLLVLVKDAHSHAFRNVRNVQGQVHVRDRRVRRCLLVRGCRHDGG